MNKRLNAFILVFAMGAVLTACGGADNTDKPEPPQTEQGEHNNANNGNDNQIDAGEQPAVDEEAGEGEAENSKEEGTATVNGSSTPVEMVTALLDAVEQPSLMDMDPAMIKDMYHFDPELAEELVIKMPMMNVKTNEIAIIKLKDAASFATVEEGIKQRAADIQKQFETYLPDQYENAKNYKIVSHDNYVLFVISEEADKIVELFNGFFTSK